MSTRFKARLNLALLLVTAAFYAVSTLGLVKGLARLSVSEQHLTFLTPSPFALYIWVIIGAVLLAALVGMLLSVEKAATARLVDAITPPFILSCLFNILWGLAFSFGLLSLAALFMLALAVSLAVLNIRLKNAFSFPHRLAALGFGLYNGWAIFASIATISAALQQLGWGRFGLSEQTWSLIILGAFLLIVLAIESKLNNAALPLGAAWACFGIMMRHSAEGKFQAQYPAVEAAAALCAVGYLVYAGGIFVLNKRCVVPRKAVSQAPGAEQPTGSA